MRKKVVYVTRGIHLYVLGSAHLRMKGRRKKKTGELD